MAQAIVARENGDDYQRLVLWSYINELLSKNSDIEVILHEFDEVKGFDDIIIKYKKPIIVCGERMIEKEYIQVKFHQHQSDFLTIENLIQPRFINSKKDSFLGNLSKAYKLLGDDYRTCLFTLYTPFDIDQKDTLYKIVDNRNRMITEKMFFDGTIKTKRAKDKNRILKHLNIADEDLKIILSRVKFYKGLSFPELINQLNIQLNTNGLVQISNNTVCNSYINLAKKWLCANKLELSREFVISECKSENLIYQIEKEVDQNIYVRTFENYVNSNEKNTNLLDLTGMFNLGKYLKKEYKWEHIYKITKEFFKEDTNLKGINGINLECSLTMAFLVGRVLNPKSGISSYPVQKTLNGVVSWDCIDEGKYDLLEDFCIVNENTVDENGLDSILIISMTNDIESDVMEYIKYEQFNVRNIYHIKSKNIGKNSIKNGAQCFNIAESIAKLLGERTRREKMSMTHLFVSAPVALMFLIGKLSLNMGKISFYEHDMTFREKDIYMKSAVFPIEGE